VPAVSAGALGELPVSALAGALLSGALLSGAMLCGALDVAG
jgi:hypothetical protein